MILHNEIFQLMYTGLRKTLLITHNLKAISYVLIYLFIFLFIFKSVDFLTTLGETNAINQQEKRQS